MKQNQKSDKLVLDRLVLNRSTSDKLILYTSLVSFGLLITTLTSFSILSSTTVSAEDIVDEVNITVPVSCTMSGNGESSHNAEILNGHYDSNIGETTMKATCNDGEGFAIYAIGYTDDTDGKNVLTSSTLGSEHDIVTGTATGPVGNEDTSQWAMKLSTITNPTPTPTYPIIIAGSTDDTTREQGDPDYSTFQEVPDDYTLVAKRTSGTDINPSGQQTAEGSTLKTTYQAYISRTQVAGTYTGQVKYTLIHPNDAPAPVACKPNGTTISTIVCMQDISSTNKSSILTSMTEEQQYILMDKRDKKTYTVSKLKDGNIWMTQNLDHDIVADGSVIYDSTTTDLPTNTVWVPDITVHTPEDTTWNWQYKPEYYDPGDLYWNGNVEDSTLMITGIPQYHIGNYYNWGAAVAMNDVETFYNSYENVNQSICPAGWTLPGLSGYSISASIEQLLVLYWDDENYEPHQTPTYYNYSGDWDGAPHGIGTFTELWLPYGGGYDGYVYWVDYTGANSQSYYSTDGGSVRCVAR